MGHSIALRRYPLNNRMTDLFNWCRATQAG